MIPSDRAQKTVFFRKRHQQFYYPVYLLMRTHGVLPRYHVPDVVVHKVSSKDGISDRVRHDDLQVFLKLLFAMIRAPVVRIKYRIDVDVMFKVNGKDLISELLMGDVSIWGDVCVASQVALVVKNTPANAGDIRDAFSIPGS